MGGHVDEGNGSVSRRGFLKSAGVAAAATSLIDDAKKAMEPVGPAPAAAVRGESEIRFKLNGKETVAKVPPSMTLLEMLRERLDMTGTKQVCDRGACGACTVHLDGRTVNSCLLLAMDATGRDVTTVEGLAVGDRLHPVQQGFVEEDAMQCGFCTPGMVMSCAAVLAKNPAPTRAECAEGISGNICRCGTYLNIFRAMDRASALAKGGK